MDLVTVRDGQLAAYTFGKGPPVIFLHGGPGDTHDYMRRMAEPLFDQHQCIFFDQRGTGGSSGFKRVASEFTVENLLEDLLAVSSFFKIEHPILVGHSWGAMYALFACIRFPDTFYKAALVSMGPLDDEMGKATDEHLLSVLNVEEKSAWITLRHQRNVARDFGNTSKVNEIDRALMRLRARAWVFNPRLRETFLDEYFRDPPPDRNVNKWIWSGAANWFSWNSLTRLTAEMWICTGANDSVPLSQTERIVAAVAGATSLILKECGHMPWLEHPEKYYRELRSFLGT